MIKQVTVTACMNLAVIMQSCFFLSGIAPLNSHPNELFLCTLHHMGIAQGQYTPLNSLLSLSFPSIHQPAIGIDWPLCPTPICAPLLATYLRSHPDARFADWVIRGVTQGYHVGFSQHIRLKSAARNLPSSVANIQVVSDYIKSESQAQRIIGPITMPALLHIQVNPIGLVPKGRETNTWRMIVDLSSLEGHSVNDGIPTDICSLHYTSVDDALHYITTLGPHTQLVKIDLKSAYRILPIHPDDRHLLGISWQGKTYFDQALPFGLRSAPKIFTAFADALAWALLVSGIRFQIHYLDDFLFFAPPFSPEGNRILHLALQVLSELGVPVAYPKIEGPSTVVTFLGIIIDTSRCELRLPPAKLDHLQILVATWLTRRSGPRSDFESLLGYLSHAATVVKQGRTFLRHLFSSLSAARGRSHHIHLGAMARADLQWWNAFLQRWNGFSFFSPTFVPTIHIFSDASGSFGCGALMATTSWFQLQWPPSWTSVDIAVKEMVPVVVAAAIWGRTWQRTRINFHSDNTAVVAVLHKRSSRHPPLMHLLRCLYFYAAYYKFEFVAHHVPGASNTAADAISRNNLSLFMLTLTPPYPAPRQPHTDRHQTAS